MDYLAQLELVLVKFEKELIQTLSDQIASLVETLGVCLPLDIDETALFDKIQELYVEAYNETERMKELVHELVPTYKIDTRKFNDNIDTRKFNDKIDTRKFND